MAGRVPAYQRRRQNRIATLLVCMVVFMLMVVVGIRSTGLKSKADAYDQRIQELESMIAEEEKRTEDIEEYRKYTKTRKYAEEVAKDKLGLVYEGEIIFKEE